MIRVDLFRVHYLKNGETKDLPRDLSLKKLIYSDLTSKDADLSQNSDPDVDLINRDVIREDSNEEYDSEYDEQHDESSDEQPHTVYEEEEEDQQEELDSIPEPKV